mgnify:CR=1 FL=1
MTFLLLFFISRLWICYNATMKTILSPRLMKIADCIHGLSSIADIGSDHSHLSKYLLENKIISYALNVEVKSGPYMVSCKNLSPYIEAGKAKVLLSYGIDDVAPGEVEAIVIAGMGGSTIIEILNKNLSHTRSFQQLILQPQHAIAEVRRFLIENAFQIVAEHLVKEEAKFYEIICACPASKKQFREDIYYHIPYLCLSEPCEELLPFLNYKKRQQEKILAACHNKTSPRAKQAMDEAHQKILAIQKIINTLL